MRTAPRVRLSPNFRQWRQLKIIGVHIPVDRSSSCDIGHLEIKQLYMFSYLGAFEYHYSPEISR